MKYRTKDGQDYIVSDRGRTVNGIIVTDRIIENPNFELVEEAAPEVSAPAQSATPPVQSPPAQVPAAQVPPAPQINDQKDQN